MPELPEVETVRVQLKDVLVGKTISGLEVFHQKTVAGDESIEDKLLGKTIKDIDRVGKLMIFSFVGEDDLFMLAHLKMTGQFFYIADGDMVTGGGHSIDASFGEAGEWPHKHTRVAFYFNDGSSLYFNDMRLFGYIRVTDKEGLEKAKKGFGPEPIAPDFPVEEFVTKLRKRQTPVKPALLDQSFISGLGNIYVDEALFRAGVRPTRKASRVTKSEAGKIAKASGEVMQESIKLGGTTFRDFMDTSGKEGSFVDRLAVFNRQGLPCPRCGTKIKKVVLRGRGTHYCPKCQS